MNRIIMYKAICRTSFNGNIIRLPFPPFSQWEQSTPSSVRPCPTVTSSQITKLSFIIPITQTPLGRSLGNNIVSVSFVVIFTGTFRHARQHSGSKVLRACTKSRTKPVYENYHPWNKCQKQRTFADYIRHIICKLRSRAADQQPVDTALEFT